MAGTLDTLGEVVSGPATHFEEFDVIRVSAAQPGARVELQVTDGGALDLAEELGAVPARIWTATYASTSLTTGLGSDVIEGGLLDDTLRGGDGDDVIYGGGEPGSFGASGGNDSLYGGAGDDALHLPGAAGRNGSTGIVDGGDGIDTLHAPGRDLDEIEITNVEVLALTDGIGWATPEQFDSFDRIVNGDEPGAAVKLYLLDGGMIDLSDELGASAAVVSTATVEGVSVTTGSGNDMLFGGNSNDLLTGGQGKDVLYGQDGTDTLYGGDGADTIWDDAENGATLIDAGTGNDTIGFEVGASFSSGTVLGGAGNDTMIDGRLSQLQISGIEVLDVALATGSAAQFESFATIRNSTDPTALIALQLVGAGAVNLVDELGGRAAKVTASSDGSTITLGAANDSLLGGRGQDTLIGGAGHDTLAGRGGLDRLEGGVGNDTYLVDDAGDLVVEGQDAGTDQVNASVTVTLAASVENLVLTGGGSAHGNAMANRMTGNGNANSLNGRDGNDALFGRSGADTLSGGTGHDTLNGEAGNDQLHGDSGNDLLSGGSELDTLRGGDGRDTLRGETGNDQLYGGSDGDVLQGDGGSDLLYGDAGDDVLSGGSEADTLNGGDGHDALQGDTANDALYGGGGNDWLTGGDGNDRLYGGAGSDRLEAAGGDGIDILEGGAGDDVYVYVSNGQPGGYSINEAARGGTDRVESTTTSGLDSNVENLTLLGTASVSGEGNEMANRIVGNNGHNSLQGLGGADTLSGGAGADALDGGAGRDTLTGGTSNDVFVFATPGEAGDTITDFRNAPGDNDVVHVDAIAFGFGYDPDVKGPLAASQFQVRADNVAQDGNDRFIFRTTDATLWFDSNGSASGGLQLVADLQAGTSLTSADILLV